MKGSTKLTNTHTKPALQISLQKHMALVRTGEDGPLLTLVIAHWVRQNTLWGPLS